MNHTSILKSLVLSKGVTVKKKKLSMKPAAVYARKRYAARKKDRVANATADLVNLDFVDEANILIHSAIIRLSNPQQVIIPRQNFERFQDAYGKETA